jgi:drug/metabolite transporter (DMT)-like permease
MIKLLFILSYCVALVLWLIFCKITKRPEPSARKLKIFTALYVLSLLVAFLGYTYLMDDLPKDLLAWETIFYCCLVGFGVYGYIRFKWKLLAPKD